MENFVFLALGGEGGILDLLVLIIVFVLILVAAYFVSKWVSNTGLNMQKNKNIKVLEVFRLNQTKYIYIVEMGSKVIAIGVTKDHIEYLTELERDSLSFTKPDNVHVNFKDLLKLSRNKLDKASTNEDVLRQFEKKEE